MMREAEVTFEWSPPFEPNDEATRGLVSLRPHPTKHQVFSLHAPYIARDGTQSLDVMFTFTQVAAVKQSATFVLSSIVGTGGQRLVRVLRECPMLRDARNGWMQCQSELEATPHLKHYRIMLSPYLYEFVAVGFSVDAQPRTDVQSSTK